MKTVLALVAFIGFAVVNAEPPTAAQRTLKQMTELDEIYEAVKKNPSEVNAKWNNRLSAQTQAMKRICIGNNGVVVEEKAWEAFTADYQAACRVTKDNWKGVGFDLGGDLETIRGFSQYVAFSTANEQDYRDLVKEYEEMYQAEANPSTTPATLVSERMDIIDEMLDPIIAADNAYDTTLHAFQIYFDSQVMAQVQAMKRICIGNNLDKVGQKDKMGNPYEISEPVTLNPDSAYGKACEVFKARWLKDSPTGKKSLKAEFAEAMTENNDAWTQFAKESDALGYKDWLRAYEAEYRKAAA